MFPVLSPRGREASIKKVMAKKRKSHGFSQIVLNAIFGPISVPESHCSFSKERYSVLFLLPLTKERISKLYFLLEFCLGRMILCLKNMFTDRSYGGFSVFCTGLKCTLQASVQSRRVLSPAVSHRGPYLKPAGCVRA